MQLETVTALDVRNGDTIYTTGFRCRVSEVRRDDDERGAVASYVLHSAPTESYSRTLPVGYEGMTSGGNELAQVTREVATA